MEFVPELFKGDDIEIEVAEHEECITWGMPEDKGFLQEYDKATGEFFEYIKIGDKNEGWERKIDAAGDVELTLYQDD